MNRAERTRLRRDSNRQNVDGNQMRDGAETADFDGNGVIVRNSCVTLGTNGTNDVSSLLLVTFIVVSCPLFLAKDADPNVCRFT
jgi:hypothetical protein